MAWSRLNFWQLAVFAISFFCMMSRHIAILGWSMVKSDAAKDMKFSSTDLGWMDSAYLLFYGFGNMLNGSLGDSYPLKIVVSASLFLTAGIFMTAATLGYYQHGIAALFVILWAGNGLFQSAVWPGTVALIGNWFPRLTRGRIMGVWSSNSSVGDVIGAELGGILLYYHYSWEGIVTTTAAIIVFGGLLFALFVEDKPSLQLVEDDAACDMEFSLLIKQRSSLAKRSISFWDAWRIPRVIPYSLTYACVKLLTYGMLFWLPFFLTRKIELPGETVGALTATFPIGGIIGGSISGWLTDRCKGNRSIVLTPMLALVIPLLVAFEFGTHENYWVFFLIIPLMGIMNAGASNLMSSAVPADLAEHIEGKLAAEAKGTVTGILNGVGALGAALGGILIGWLQTFDWTYVFLFLIAVSALATGLLISIMIKDLQEIRQNQSAKTVEF